MMAWRTRSAGMSESIRSNTSRVGQRPSSEVTGCETSVRLGTAIRRSVASFSQVARSPTRSTTPANPSPDSHIPGRTRRSKVITAPAIRSGTTSRIDHPSARATASSANGSASLGSQAIASRRRKTAARMRASLFEPAAIRASSVRRSDWRRTKDESIAATTISAMTMSSVAAPLKARRCSIHGDSSMTHGLTEGRSFTPGAGAGGITAGGGGGGGGGSTTSGFGNGSGAAFESRGGGASGSSSGTPT